MRFQKDWNRCPLSGALVTQLVGLTVVKWGKPMNDVVDRSVVYEYGV
jgi:hypothetical protein